MLKLSIPAQPQLNIVRGVLWQLPVEPRRSVEGAARVLWPTTFSVPQRVIVVPKPCCRSIAKVITPHKRWWVMPAIH